MENAENLARTIREAELEKSRLEAAISVGLPIDLSDWLRGESAEALTKDAEALLAVLPKAKASPVAPVKKTEGRTARKIRQHNEARSIIKAALGH